MSLARKIAALFGSGVSQIDPALMSTALGAKQATLTGTANVPGLDAALALKASSASAVVTKSYESAEQAISIAAQLVLAHGMGIVPKSVVLILRCKTAELNYAVGNEVIISQNQTIAAASCHFSVVIDVTNITIRLPASSPQLLFIGDKTTGGAVAVTNANWRIVVRAYA